MFYVKNFQPTHLVCAEVEVKQQFPVYSFVCVPAGDTCICKRIMLISKRNYTLEYFCLFPTLFSYHVHHNGTSMRMDIKSILFHSFSPTLSTLGSSCRTTQGCCEKNLNHSILCNSLHLRFIFYPKDALLHYHLQLIISLQLGLWC